MKKTLFIAFLVTGLTSLAQNLQTVTTNGATTNVPVNVTTTDPVGNGISSITGETDKGAGVKGNATDTGTGVFGNSVNGTGVHAASSCASGLFAFSNTGTSGLFSMGTTAKGIIIDSDTNSTGNFFTLNKNGVTKLVVNQAGEMTAYKFIKEGGTASQFLKADGSVDSNTYLTTLNAISILFPNGFPTFTASGGIITSSVQISTGVPSTIASFDHNKNLVGLSTNTYPSLAELAYVKGVTGSIQNQINNKQNPITLTTGGTSGAATFTGNVLNIPQYAGSIPTQTITNGVATTAPSEDAVFDALALKANDNNVVHLTGNEIINGTKTFTSGINFGTSNSSIFKYGSDSFYYVATGSTHQFGGGPGSLQNNVSVANGTFKIDLQTANTIASFDASKNVVSLPTAIYPSLNELSFLKGVTSSIQTQLNSKGNGTVTSIQGFGLGTTGTDLSTQVISATTSPILILNVPTASATNRGALSSTDWSSFNNKQNALTFTTTGTSGPATLTGSTLNIPQYAGSAPSQTITNGVTTSSPSQDALFDALALKANIASPTFSGVPAAPTAVAGTNTTQLATTAFVTTANNLKANIASPTFTGAPMAPTAVAGTNTTQLATTAFVTTANNLKANIASPTFSGVPAAPTAVAGTNTTQLATTAFVTAATNLKENPLSFNSPLIRSSNTISINNASSTANGALTSTDWNTFNNKQNALTLTTTGTSGAATLTGSTLNIPQYAGGDGNWTLATDDITNNNPGNVNVKLNATKKFSFLNSLSQEVGSITETGLGTFGNTNMNLTTMIGAVGGNQFLYSRRVNDNYIIDFNLFLGNPQSGINQPFGFYSSNYVGTLYQAGGSVGTSFNPEHSFAIGGTNSDAISTGIFRISRTRLQSTVPMKYATDLSASYDNRTLVDKEYVDTKVVTTTGAQSLQTVTTVGGTTNQLITINPTAINFQGGEPNVERSALTVTNSDIFDPSGSTFGIGITGSGSIGVQGIDSNGGGTGVLGSGATGVRGINSYGNGNGVYGESNGGDPLIGVGVRGVSDLGKGVVGTSSSGIGVLGYSQNIGVVASGETTGLEVQVSSSGLEAIKAIMSGAAKGIVLNSTTTSTGNPIEVKKDNVSKLVVNQEGELTASKIIKSGGLATQYLMADGSTTTGTTATDTNWTLATTNITNNNLGNVDIKLQSGKELEFLNSSNVEVGSVNETGLGTFGNSTINLIARIGPLGSNQFLSGWRSQANFNLFLGNPQSGVDQPFGFYSSNYVGTLYQAGGGVGTSFNPEHSFAIGGTNSDAISTGIFRIGRTRLQSTVPMKYATNLSSSYDNRTLVDKEYVDTAISVARPYKVYTALMSQSGTSAPIATVLENTLGGTITWSRTTAGNYLGTLTGAFPFNKTWAVAQDNAVLGGLSITTLRKTGSPDSMQLIVSNGSTGVDSSLAGTSIEIRIYN